MPAGHGDPRGLLRLPRPRAGVRPVAGARRRYLPPFAPEHRLDTDQGRIVGQRGQPGHVLPAPQGYR